MLVGKLDVDHAFLFDFCWLSGHIVLFYPKAPSGADFDGHVLSCLVHYELGHLAHAKDDLVRKRYFFI